MEPEDSLSHSHVFATCTCPKYHSRSEAYVYVSWRYQFSWWGVVSTSPNTPFRLSATAYSIYWQLPSILQAVPPSTTRGRAMLWWQGPTYETRNNSSSSSSCFWRVRCVPCSLILKVELVPPSLLRLSNVPSSFWSVFQCLTWQSISVHPLYVL